MVGQYERTTEIENIKEGKLPYLSCFIFVEFSLEILSQKAKEKIIKLHFRKIFFSRL